MRRTSRTKGAQLLQEKGELHELQFLERLHAEGRDGGRDRDGRALGLRRRCGPYAGRDARRRRCDLASDLRERPVARPRRLPDEGRRVHRSSARGATKRSTRSSLAPRSRPTCCSSASTATASPAFRGDVPSTCTCFSASASNARCATTISPPTTAACARGSKRPIGSTARDRGLSGRALRPVQLSCRVSIALDRRGSSRAGGGSAPRASRAAARRWIADDDGTRSGRAGNRRSADRAPFLRDACAIRRRSRSKGGRPDDWIGMRSSATRAAASSSCRSRRAAT